MREPTESAPSAQRKTDHLKWGQSPEATMTRSNGLDEFELRHEALPEMHLDEVDTGVTFLGHDLKVPLLISSMTGGTAEARRINENLARAADKVGAAMAVGSQRIMLHDPSCRPSFAVARDVAPDLLLFGNLGAQQVTGEFDDADAREAVERIGADGLFLHLNPLQEAIQMEGNADFRGILNRIGQLAERLPFPVLVKEVGCGMTSETAMALARQGVAAIDVSGAGGTSWARIEGLRASDPRRARLGSVFGEWGISTADSLKDCRRALPTLPLIASGGIRNGLEAAKALALGANLVATAGLLLGPASDSADKVIEALELFILELRVALFVSGARDIVQLQTGKRLRRVRR